MFKFGVLFSEVLIVEFVGNAGEEEGEVCPEMALAFLGVEAMQVVGLQEELDEGFGIFEIT